MNRRCFLLSLTAIPVVAFTGVSIAANRFTPHLDLLLQRLSELQGKTLISRGAWNPSQIFQHLAQSVEGSLQGYPELNSAWFRHTVGPLALSTFKAFGAMHHSLEEPIPGAIPLSPSLLEQETLEYLIELLHRFLVQTKLSPHFAYGVLSRADYIAAHQLHIEQHLTQIEVVG